MSELVSRLAVNYLRKYMFPALPQSMQQDFPLYTDPLLINSANGNPVPNIVVGQYSDFGVNLATPAITVYCSGAQEGMVNVYRHLDLHVDIWVGGNLATNSDGRRYVSVLYEYVNRSLQNTNWTGIPPGETNTVRIQRSYETERSPILFEASDKVYHIANIYRVEAISSKWY